MKFNLSIFRLIITDKFYRLFLVDYYFDTYSNLGRYRALYYRVKAIDYTNGEIVAVSGVEHNRQPRDLMAMEIARRNNLLLRRHVGIPTFTYLAKTLSASRFLKEGFILLTAVNLHQT